MPDELTNVESTQSAPDGQAAAPVEGASQDGGKKVVNLFEIEEFRRWQAAQDKRAAALQEENRLMAQRLKEIETQSMTEEQRLIYDLKEKEAELNYLKQQMEAEQRQRQMEEVKRKDVQALADLSGLPFDKLMAAANYDEALQMAHQHALKQRKAAEKGVEEPAYIPRGTVSNAALRNDSEVRKAIENKDGASYFKAVLRGLA